MITMTIKTTSAEATDRVLNALCKVLTQAELTQFQKQVKSEMARLNKKKKSKTKL